MFLHAPGSQANEAQCGQRKRARLGDHCHAKSLRRVLVQRIGVTAEPRRIELSFGGVTTPAQSPIRETGTVNQRGNEGFVPFRHISCLVRSPVKALAKWSGAARGRYVHLRDVPSRAKTVVGDVDTRVADVPTRIRAG